MEPSKVDAYARQLYEELGARSIAVAAQRATNFEANDDQEQSKTWRRIESVLLNIRGPHQG